MFAPIIDLLHEIIGLLLAVVVIAVAGAVSWWMYRSWQAERGVGLMCPNCGRALGRERYGRWGPYRKCLGGGHSISRDRYESQE